jgi:uncharacterized membrane protein
MLRITSQAFHEKVSAQKGDIILNGAPRDLRGTISVSNRGDEAVKVRSLPLKHGTRLGNLIGTEHNLHMSARLQPGEEQVVEITHSVPPNTPPGTYESTIMVGGESRNVKVIVQHHIEIEIYPTRFTFSGTEPGKVHEAVFTLTNLGNVPFQVPEVKHVAALDMDMFCTALGFAMRNTKGDGYEQVLNDIARSIKGNLPDWADSTVAEYGMTLQPGENKVIHVNIIIPANCKPNKDYCGNMRFWDKAISYVIKSNNEKQK